MRLEHENMLDFEKMVATVRVSVEKEEAQYD